MNTIRKFAVLAVVILAMVVGLAALSAGAADHLDAPTVRTDGRLDINDVYAFTHGDNTVLAMTVNPAAGVLSPTTLRATPGARYEFNIDNDGDYRADIMLFIRPEKVRPNGTQKVNLYWKDLVSGKQRRIAAGMSDTNLAIKTGGWFYAGLRDDPFFFDLQAFRDQVGGAGGSRMFCDANTVDFFTGFNATAIVVEIPSAQLTNDGNTINVWARTTAKGGATFDRMGKPALNTVFIASSDKNAYNNTKPADDLATWGGRFSAVLMLFGGYDQATADTITGLLLPDVLTLDTSSSNGFVGTLNGRQLAEDVIDFELGVVTNGGIPNDCVNANDATFMTAFPYMAGPH
ncbi:MAG: DUF4331 domain-containing protein [Candidatus Promineofilum sp.]|nr:DUF4331 domain-containing protein [Promineifilum sp.]MCW5864021.1 DUF4331 family protein [Anaerolineae bacterium]